MLLHCTPFDWGCKAVFGLASGYPDATYLAEFMHAMAVLPS